MLIFQFVKVIFISHMWRCVAWRETRAIEIYKFIMAFVSDYSPNGSNNSKLNFCHTSKICRCLLVSRLFRKNIANTDGSNNLSLNFCSTHKQLVCLLPSLSFTRAAPRNVLVRQLSANEIYLWVKYAQLGRYRGKTRTCL